MQTTGASERLHLPQMVETFLYKRQFTRDGGWGGKASEAAPLGRVSADEARRLT